MSSFQWLTERTKLPIILLFTKVDSLWDRIQDKPISHYDASFQGDSDYQQACEYFADRFQKLDRRLLEELHIYYVNAVDSASVEKVFDDIRVNVLNVRPNPLGWAYTIPSKRLYRRQPAGNSPALSVFNVGKI